MSVITKEKRSMYREAYRGKPGVIVRNKPMGPAKGSKCVRVAAARKSDAGAPTLAGRKRSDNVKMGELARDDGGRHAGRRKERRVAGDTGMVPMPLRNAAGKWIEGETAVPRHWTEDALGMGQRPVCSEGSLEYDADFPPSKVRLKDHPRGEAWCRQQVAYWTGGGFLPVAVSRLVGLCPADCRKIQNPKGKIQGEQAVGKKPRRVRLRVKTEHGVIEATEGPVHYGSDPARRGGE